MAGSITPSDGGCSELARLHRVDLHRNSCQESQRSDSAGTEWTDEKHSKYLQSMEASFVDQLYNSLELHGALSQKEYSSDPKSSKQMHFSTRIPSGQFKALRDGSWTNINFRRGESLSRNSNEPHDILVNPWVRHYRSGRRHQTVTNPNIQGNTIVARSWHHDSTDSNTEVTDQNFVDEDLDKVVASQTGIVNKMKTPVIASTSNDQVVPCREFPTKM